MTPYRLLIYVDNKIRDLPRLALLKVLLEDRYGHRVALLPSHMAVFEAARAWQPHLVVFHHLRKFGALQQADRLRACGVLTAVLATEYWYGYGLDGQDAAREFARSFADPARLDLYFTSHPETRAILEAEAGRALPMARYIGNLSFDFYAPPLRSLLTPRPTFYARHRLDSDQPTLLFITSFPVVDEKHVSKQAKSRLDEVINWQDRVHDQQTHKRLFMETIAQVAQRWPRLNLILRPHPFEAIQPGLVDAYRDYFAGQGVLERVRIISEGHIAPLLNQADLVLHSWSTVALEAWLLGLPTVSLTTEPLRDEAMAATVGQVTVGDWRVHDVAAAVEALGEYAHGGAIPADIAQARRDFLAYHLPYPAGEIAAQAAAQIDALLREAAPRLNFTPLYRSLLPYRSRRGLLRYHWHRLSGRLPGTTPTPPAFNHAALTEQEAAKVPTLEEIESQTAAIRAALTSVPSHAQVSTPSPAAVML